MCLCMCVCVRVRESREKEREMSMGSKNAVISNLGFIPLAYLQRSK